jgi:hypothetical protein
MDRLVPVSEARRAELRSWAEYDRRLRRVRAAWTAPAFLSGVARVLRAVGFLDPVAALLAPWMLCEYVEWADPSPACRRYAYRHGAPHLIEPACPLRPTEPAARPTDRTRRMPRHDREYLRERAEWYFGIEVQGRRIGISRSPGRPANETDPGLAALIAWAKQQDADADPLTVHGVARRVHAASEHGKTLFSADLECGCRQKVRTGIREVKRLLGVSHA